MIAPNLCRATAGLVVAATVVAGCGILSVPGATGRSTTESPSAPRSSAIPGVVPAPHWPIPGIDAGNTAAPSPGPDGLIDTAWAWGSLEWSPNGGMLAAAAESQEAGEGQIHLFDRTGHPAGALPGWQAAWLDDGHLVTLEEDAGPPSFSAWLWSADASSSYRITGNATELHGSRHGSVAITQWLPDGDPTVRVWADGHLSASLPGIPAAWSRDGTHLAVFRDASTSFSHDAGATLTATGDIWPGWLEVLEASDLREVAGFPGSILDPRTLVLFDPSGAFVATSSFVFDLHRQIARPLPKGLQLLAWGNHGSAIFVSLTDHSVASWDPGTGSLGRPYPAGIQLPTADGRVVTVPSPVGELPLELVTGGVVSPDGQIRAWYPPANGMGDTPLRLVPTAGADKP